jgi:biofilm PGA synthesis N-glycosyltransferase PgaC
MPRWLRSPSYLLAGGLLVGASAVLVRIAYDASLALPLRFDTVYHGLRTTLALSMFGLLLVLLVRHTLLLFFSFADQVERSVMPPKTIDDDKLPLVSIIAPAFNEGPCIEASIRSLLTLDYPRYEVVVVDDGSTDDTLSRARKLEGDHGNARVVVLWKPNGGKASALNFGLARAAGEFVTTMDSDSVLERGTLRAAMRYFADPTVAAVAGRVVVINPATLWSRLQFLEYIKGLNFVRRAQGFLRAVSIVPGPIGVFRRAAIAQVGYYAEDTFAEDCDLTLKLLTAGWQICYEPLAEARTEAPEQLLPLIKQRYRWTRGILQALRKHRGALFIPRGRFVATVMLWYMVFEALIWPLMTCVSIVGTLLAGLDGVLRASVVCFWLLLLLLEMSTTLYCVMAEEESALLLLYAPIDRMVFSIVLDISRILATCEEFFGLKMSWGKLDRKGIR